MLGFIYLFAVAALASASPAVNTGVTCPYIASSACTIRPPIEAECLPVIFNKCIKAPSSYVHFYDIIFYNPETKEITFQRYNDSECKDKYNDFPAPHGKDGDCIGPIEKVWGIKAYIKVSVN